VSKQILLVNGAYREHGITDQMLELMQIQLKLAGLETELIVLREIPLELCTNCRHCALQTGEAPGHCVINDGMGRLIDRIESADGFVFASPTNFGTVTAIFKRFLERLTIFGYWPWDQPAPVYRRKPVKPALCISSCAAPSLMGRFVYGTMRTLNEAVKCVGGKRVDTLMIGLSNQELPAGISPRDQRRIEAVTKKLIDRL
jgi:hypothetical protein